MFHMLFVTINTTTKCGSLCQLLLHSVASHSGDPGLKIKGAQLMSFISPLRWSSSPTMCVCTGLCFTFLHIRVAHSHTFSCAQLATVPLTCGFLELLCASSGSISGRFITDCTDGKSLHKLMISEPA